MSMFGKDRQFMSDLELEEANASLLNENASRKQQNKAQQQRTTQSQFNNSNTNQRINNLNSSNSGGGSGSNNTYNQNQYNTSTSGGGGRSNQHYRSSNVKQNNNTNAPPSSSVQHDRQSSQDPPTNNRDFNDVFNQLGEAYTRKNPDNYPGNSAVNPRSSQRPVSSHCNTVPDEDLIDMNADLGPMRGPPLSSGGNHRMSPVHSDHPSDLTDATWNSRAGLVGVPPSRGGTQPRPSGAPAISANPRPQQQQSGAIMESREPQFARPNDTVRSNAYQRAYSTVDRPERYHTQSRPVTPPPPEMEPPMGGGGYGYGLDTLTRGGPIEDDRRSHFSVATSVVSTVPLSTQPAATKTMSGLYALLLIMLGVAVTTGDIVSRRSYDPKYADYYAMYVFGAGTLAALYLCLACIYGKRRGDAPIDHHNGSIYIRIGATVFCLGSLAHSAIILAETFQYQENCFIYARLGSISLRALFQVTQLFVVLIHSKVCIQSWNGLARLVLAHVIAANFLMWFKITLKETLESIVVNVPRHYHNIRMFCERNYANSFTDMEEESNPILVPMAVAYCIIAGFTLFAMWRNIGKDYAIEHREESCEEHEKQLTFECKEGVTGVMGGAFAILASISVLVLWIMFSNDKSLYDYLVSIYQAYNATWLAILIFLFPIAAAALKRHKKQDHYHNSLNRPILIVTTTGTFAYCILNIMSSAVLIIHSFSWVALATLIGYSVHTVEVAIQTVYLLDGLRRCPRKKRKPPSKSFVVFFLLVNVSLWITIIFELKESALNPLQEDFYGIINWKVMLHFVGPIASLYRFHSVCCFLDVWKFAY